MATLSEAAAKSKGREKSSLFRCCHSRAAGILAHMKHPLFAVIASVSLLAACTPATPTPIPSDDEGSSSSARQASSVREEIASFQGIIEEAGISIYMQGSHRLRLANDGFLLLESDNLNLDDFEGQEVEVYGTLRDTVESGGRIMNVSEVTVLSGDSSSSEALSMSSISQAQTSSAVAAQASSKVAVSSRSSVALSSVRSSVASSLQAASAQTASAASTDDAMKARVQTMAGYNYAAANWSREYCSPNQGFCFPAHKNFYFKSFGATSSYLWHVEVSNAEIVNLGEGPISVNLHSGTVASKSATDRQVRDQGELTIGFIEWTDNKHFEVVGPVELKTAIAYITANLKALPASSASSN